MTHYDGVVDKDTLLERVDNDVELLAELVDIFEEDAAEHLKALETAISTQDGSALEEAAHSLKGSSYNMSADSLAAIALELEVAGKEGSFDGTEEKLEMLKLEYGKVIPALKQILKEAE